MTAPQRLNRKNLSAFSLPELLVVLAIMICITACNTRERIRKDVLYVTSTL